MFSKSTIKYIQSLQHKKFRDEYNAFVAEGPKVVTELLQTGIFSCKAVYATQDWITANESIAHLFNSRVEIVKDFELEKTKTSVVIVLFDKRRLAPLVIQYIFLLCIVVKTYVIKLI